MYLCVCVFVCLCVCVWLLGVYFLLGVRCTVPGVRKAAQGWGGPGGGEPDPHSFLVSAVWMWRSAGCSHLVYGGVAGVVGAGGALVA